jgi:hypothetical protein
MTTANPRLDDKSLERRVIIGSLALDSSLDLAAQARVLLDVPDSVSDCAHLTTGLRQLFFGPATAIPKGSALRPSPE